LSMVAFTPPQFVSERSPASALVRLQAQRSVTAKKRQPPILVQVLALHSPT
jgi:hypothetical protein